MRILSFFKQYLFHNHTPRQTVAKNMFWLLVWEVSYKVIQAALTFFLAYSIWKEQFGIYSYITSVIWTLILIVDYNLIQTSIRSVKQWFLSSNETIKASIQIKLLLSLVWVIIVFCIPIRSWFFWLLLLYYGYSFFSNSAAYLRSCYRHNEEMEKESFLKTIGWYILLFISWGILLITRSLELFIRWLFIAWVLDLLITWLFIRKKHLSWWLLPNNRQSIRNLLYYWFPLAISSFLVSLYINADQILLWYYGYNEWLWIYSFAYKITLLFTTFSWALFAAIFPQTNSTIAVNNSKAIFRQWAVTILSRNSLIISFLMICTYLLNLFWWSIFWEYSPALWVLQILRLYCLLEPLWHWWYTILISLKKDKINLLFLAITALINIIGNIIFIPHYGYIASAWTTVFSYFTYTLLCFITINQWLPTMSKE